ncbi:MAG: hypothetical protein ACPGUV_01125 [Polyangiales bacterium]
MKTVLKRLMILLALGFALPLVGCGDDDDVTTPDSGIDGGITDGGTTTDAGDAGDSGI